MAKISYKYINPKSIKRLSEKELRTAYSEFRSILRKRVERFQSAGVKTSFKVPRPIKEVSAQDIASLTVDIASQLRNPESKVSTFIKISGTLKSHDYNIDVKQLDDFGRFMEATRKRQGETYKGKSGIAAQAYTELVKTGVSGKTIARSFRKWLEDSERLNLLVTAAQNAADTHPGKRVTAAELQNIMRDFGV